MELDAVLDDALSQPGGEVLVRQVLREFEVAAQHEVAKPGSTDTLLKFWSENGSPLRKALASQWISRAKGVIAAADQGAAKAGAKVGAAISRKTPKGARIQKGKAAFTQAASDFKASGDSTTAAHLNSEAANLHQAGMDHQHHVANAMATAAKWGFRAAAAAGVVGAGVGASRSFENSKPAQKAVTVGDLAKGLIGRALDRVERAGTGFGEKIAHNTPRGARIARSYNSRSNAASMLADVHVRAKRLHDENQDIDSNVLSEIKRTKDKIERDFEFNSRRADELADDAVNHRAATGRKFGRMARQGAVLAPVGAAVGGAVGLKRWSESKHRREHGKFAHKAVDNNGLEKVSFSALTHSAPSLAEHYAGLASEHQSAAIHAAKMGNPAAAAAHMKAHAEAVMMSRVHGGVSEGPRQRFSQRNGIMKSVETKNLGQMMNGLTKRDEGAV